MISLVFPSLKEVCYLLLRQLHNIRFQEEYDEMLEYITSSTRFHNGKLDMSASLNWVVGMGVNATSGTVVKHEIGSPIHTIVKIYQQIDTSLIIPLTVFPRWEYRKESKLEYSFLPKVSSQQISLFRKCVDKYLRESSIKSVFHPPPEVLPKVGSSLYNDGGVEREDWIAPKLSWSSGFKWQSFNPRPLQTREVWLPDKVTKISNSFWMSVGRQILLADDRYPHPDPEVTWERIRERLDSVGVFDISAFGLQYPREYLCEIADAIAHEFPSPDIQEQAGILRKIFEKVSLTLESGEVVYPPRGIGLGYYEDLKTIGIMSILYGLDVISLYGDQGILSSEDAQEGFRRIKLFGFKQKPDKEKIHIRNLKWSGRIMSRNALEKPKLLIESFQSIFDREFHWERKQAIASYYEAFPEMKERVSKYLVPWYPLLYGYEFNRMDSQWSIHEGGVSGLKPMSGGWIRTLKIRHLRSPRDQIIDNMTYSSMFFVEWKRTQAKDFSILRKEAYRNSIPFPSEVWEYSRPILELNNTKKPSFSLMQSSVSEMMDLKLVAALGLSLGKVTHNLFGENLYKAIVQCGRHQNPFEAFSTGGYQVKTAWRSAAAVSKETQELVDSLYWNLDKMWLYTTSRREPLPSIRKEFYQIQGVKRTLEGSKYPSWGNTPTGFVREPDGTLTHKKIRYEDLQHLNPCESKGSMVQPVSDVLSDLRNRFNDSIDSTAFDFEAEDIDSDDALDFEEYDEDLYETLVYEE
ncbi:putative RNA-dependent RNA polymerase [Downy mildew lesion associated ormycovirus 5]|uniref:RNA-dependent RNA polymerase n=1 Tax=Downy mildew lesion associated ormycovirus 5 TaxID=3162773 RepID=A0AAT9QFW9_9VIRU|nr:putative RNA-dependent RNA polymerase [Plasmopara viticola lesion-associated ormycovirus 5]